VEEAAGPSGGEETAGPQAGAPGEVGLAGRIALEGVEAAGRGVPVERMGAWASVDRTEIESLRIDPGALRAFLSAPAYLHGARSMESIVDMSALTGARSYERAALPAAHQLAMHVDAEAFLGLVRGPAAP
jgi:hypothetical protein